MVKGENGIRQMLRLVLFPAEIHGRNNGGPLPRGLGVPGTRDTAVTKLDVFVIQK